MARVYRGTLLSAAGLACSAWLVAGCGVSDGFDRLQETIDESFEDPEPASTPASGIDTDRLALNEWFTYVSESGSFSVDLPAEPDYVDTGGDESIIGTWAVERESDRYGITEYQRKVGKPYDFDAGMTSAVDRSVSVIEGRVEEPVTAAITEEKLEVLDSNLGVRFTASIDVADDAYGTLHGALFEADETVVLLTMIDLDGDNAESARRFIDSLDLTP